MAKRIASLTKEQIVEFFPNLASDPDFEITSNADPSYNCIAWAYIENSKWMWPKSSESVDMLDAIRFWPDGVENNEDVTSFIKAFQLKGYSICDSWEHEEGFQKIALYVQGDTTVCTHAAREIVADKNNCGKWTSKLGPSNDIHHSSPYELEGAIYGRVHCIMKREHS
jgi:hypothetical protein